MSATEYPGVSFKYQGGNYFVGTVTPTGTVGDLWSDTTTGVVLKVCTTAPSTWDSVEGGAGSFTDLAATGTFTLSGVITPTQLAANTDNWAPTGLSGAAVIRVSTDASRNLTGITGGAAGRILILQNVGSFDLVLMNDVTSTAANRFLIGGDITVATNKCAVLQYDSTSSRWRGLALPGSAAGGQGNWIAADNGAAPSVAPTAAGADAITIGDGSTAAGANGIVLGCSAVGGASANVINIGTFANSGVTAGAYSVTIGSDDSATDNAQATGAGAIAVGSSGGSTGNAARAAGANAIAVGSATGAIDGPIASGANSIAIGSANATTAGPLASATAAIAIGSAAEADATLAIAIGHFANSGLTAGVYSICIGSDDSASDNARATGQGAIAIGSSAGDSSDGAKATGVNSTAIGCAAGGGAAGNGASAAGNNSVAIGPASSATQDSNISIGNSSNATGSTQAIAIGGSAVASGGYSIAIGGNADATQANSIAIGTAASGTDADSANATAIWAIALGSNAQADRYGEFVLPSQNTGTAARTSNARWTGTTTDATPTEIFLLGVASNRLTLPSDSGAYANLNVIARRTDADGECGAWTVDAALDNNAGTTAGFGATAFVTTIKSTDFTTATVAASADNTNDALAITVTGEAGKTIRWVVHGLVTEARG